AGGQEAEAFVEPARKLLQRQDSQPRHRQLDGQRNAIKPLADRSDRRGIGVGEGKSTAKRARALDEEPHRSVFARARRRQGASGAGNDGTRTTLSPAIASRSRLDARIDNRGQLRMSASATRAASAMTCSQLSTISKSSLFLSANASVSIAPLGALRLTPKT